MRHIGNIAETKQAERFGHFLASQHIDAALRSLQDTVYAVWMCEEDCLDTARRPLEAFLAMPDDQRFDVAKVHQPRAASDDFCPGTRDDTHRVSGHIGHDHPQS